VGEAAGQPSEAAVDAAIAWKVQLESRPEDDALRAEWAAWLASDPEHALAWRRLEQVDARLAGVPRRLASETLARAPADPDRRRVLKGLGALALLGAGGWGMQHSGLWDRLRADHATAVGERRRIALADGGTLWLNTDTAVSIADGDGPRRIRLLRGELRLQTGAEGVEVATRHGRLSPLGTRFVVRDGTHATHVWVEAGAVRAVPERGGAPDTVAAGGAARLLRDQVMPLGDRGLDPAAWAEGLIAADAARLGDFLAELARYRTGWLRWDPAVADRRISGVFQLRDTDAVLETLAATLPVEIDWRTRWWVSVRPARRG